MNKKTIIFLILSSLLFVACTQSKWSDRNKLSDLEQRVETYIAERIIPPFHQSVEFEEKKEFNLNQLIADHKVPKMYSDIPSAFEENEEAFKELEELSNNTNIAYSMIYQFEYKNNETDPWYSSWMLMLLDENEEIVGHVRYNP